MNLFVYGTLLFPEVLMAVLGRVPDRTPAVATGWRVAALPDRVYPGLVPAPRGTAEGMVLGELTTAERRLLDVYESAEYRLVAIELADGRSCHTYVWQDGVLDHDWDRDAFAAHRLADYVARHRGPPDR